MWNFGFRDLVNTLKKAEQVKMDAKQFIPCDSFMYLMWTAFLLCALDIFAKQRDFYTDSRTAGLASSLF
jgi:hypothetical protein